jgi:hypothetical protein
MPKYVIPVTYMMYSKYTIDAPTLVDALDKVQGLPLPEDAVYLDESVNIIEEDVMESNDLSDDDCRVLSDWLAEDYRQRND